MREALRVRARVALARDNTDLGWREGLIVRDRDEAPQIEVSDELSGRPLETSRPALFGSPTCARRE
jgi:hypothetical protein